MTLFSSLALNGGLLLPLFLRNSYCIYCIHFAMAGVVLAVFALSLAVGLLAAVLFFNITPPWSGGYSAPLISLGISLYSSFRCF